MKFSGYYVYINLNIWEDFQICISVPLRILNFAGKIFAIGKKNILPVDNLVTIFLLLINVIVIKYVTEALISLL